MDPHNWSESQPELSATTKACIERLVGHRLDPHDLTKYPLNRQAAVLVLLYEQVGQLRVLLTTRSKTLRTHPGQTALPGGRADETDIDLIQTAFREAHEEVGLPLNSPDIRTLCVLEPVISIHKLVVTPVVAFLSNPAVLGQLKASEREVSHIFSHPLEAILEPSIAQSEPLVKIGSEDWIYDAELYNTSDSVLEMLGNTTYRMHRFRSSASPIKGLTADILTNTAEITFGKPPAYERYAPDQLRGFKAITRVVHQNPEGSLPKNYTS